MEKEKVSVLVIDGDAASRNYLVAMLQESGYAVLSASQGREGLISAWKDRPEIIILDPVLPDMTGTELVKRLHLDHRTEAVPCIALSSQQDSQDMKELIAVGCKEYLTKSNQAMPRLLEMIPNLISSEPREIVKGGILVTFLSAKGGTGTSSLCANIAMCLGSEKPEPRVAVVDLVLPIGSIADIVGCEERMDLVTIAKQEPAQITPAFFRDNLPRVSNWYFHLLAGSPDPESSNQLAVDRLDGIIGAIIETYDFIFVDMGRMLSRISLPIIHKANVVVLIVGTDLSSAILTKTVWEYLKNQGIDLKRVYPLQNRAVGLEGLSRTEFEQRTGISIRMTMPYMSDNFTIANNRHEPVISKYPNDSSTIILKQVANQIAEIGHQSHGKSS